MWLNFIVYLFVLQQCVHCDADKTEKDEDNDGGETDVYNDMTLRTK